MKKMVARLTVGEEGEKERAMGDRRGKEGMDRRVEGGAAQGRMGRKGGSRRAWRGSERREEDRKGREWWRSMGGGAATEGGVSS